MVTRYLSECIYCPYTDDCFEWDPTIYPRACPDGCRKREDVVDSYDMYRGYERDDYSALTDEEFEALKEVFEKLKED